MVVQEDGTDIHIYVAVQERRAATLVCVYICIYGSSLICMGIYDIRRHAAH